jgi:hypothetical protein
VLDIESHHVGKLVADAVGLEIRDRGQGFWLAQHAQPRIQENPLLDGPDHREIGANEFHSQSNSITS